MQRKWIWIRRVHMPIALREALALKAAVQSHAQRYIDIHKDTLSDVEDEEDAAGCCRIASCAHWCLSLSAACPCASGLGTGSPTQSCLKPVEDPEHKRARRKGLTRLAKRLGPNSRAEQNYTESSGIPSRN